MSFGFSPSDVVAVAGLAWSLYEALKDCPEEVEKISKDLATVYGILNHVKEDLDASESVIKVHGEERMLLLKTMVRDLEKTLREVKKLVEQYRHLGITNVETTASKRDQMWIKMKWVVGQRKIKRVHQDISMHISRFGLLMTAMGNSSLMRIESGLEEMRISSISNEDPTANKNGNDVSIDESEDEDKALPDVSNPKGRILNPYSKNGDVGVDKHGNGLPLEQRELKNEAMPNAANSTSEILDQGSFQIDEDGIYLDLIKPSAILTTNLSALNYAEQEKVAVVILDCSKIACYKFYETHQLWRTQSKNSTSLREVVFQRARDNRLPTDFHFFELQEWLSRVDTAWRAWVIDGVSTRTIDKAERAEAQGFSNAYRIQRIMWPLGGVDVSVAEQSLVYARNLCHHLRHWECANWLKALHMKLLEPAIRVEWYTDFIDRWTRYRDSILQQPPRGPKVFLTPSHATAAATPRKRARMDDNTTDQGSEDVSPTQSPAEEFVPNG